MLMLLLFFTGLFAGTVDAIAGGGGLISVPMLLSLGIPPHLAFGTNKLQSTIGTFAAARRYHLQGLISLKSGYTGLLFGTLGAVSGSVASQIMSSDILRKVIPVLLLIILFYTVLSPRLGLKDQKPRMKEFMFYLVFGFGLGFYDGFFGPGVGSFWVFCLAFFMGHNLIKATAYTKLFNVNTNFISTICFALGSNIDYKIGLCMAAGQLIGGRLGASLAIKNGARLIRPIFLCIVSITTGSLIYKAYAHNDMMTRIFQPFGVFGSVMLGLFMLMGLATIYLKMSRRVAGISTENSSLS